jgi:hypothetical protein
MKIEHVQIYTDKTGKLRQRFDQQQRTYENLMDFLEKNKDTFRILCSKRFVANKSKNKKRA